MTSASVCVSTWPERSTSPSCTSTLTLLGSIQSVLLMTSFAARQGEIGSSPDRTCGFAAPHGLDSADGERTPSA